MKVSVVKSCLHRVEAKTSYDIQELMDSGWLEPDSLGMIHHESMELTLQEAVDMVDAIGGLDDNGWVSETPPRVAGTKAGQVDKDNVCDVIYADSSYPSTVEKHEAPDPIVQAINPTASDKAGIKY